MSRQILESNNYQRFVFSDFNRDVVTTKYLYDSMCKYGFLDAYPIMVKRNGAGKLEILDGHHRFMVAQELGIPVKYVEEKQTINIPDLWMTDRATSMADWLTSYSRAGREVYLAVRDYRRETGIPLNACISMLGGETAGSHNKSTAFKKGTFTLGDPAHAGIIKNIVLHCKKAGIEWGANNQFVAALSRVSQAKGFDVGRLKNKISTFSHFMERQPTIRAYEALLESIYNRQSQHKVPLGHLANEAARERNAVKPAK